MITDRVAPGTRKQRSSRDACRRAASCSITGTALHGVRRIKHGVIRRRGYGDWRTHHQSSCRDTRMTMAVLYLLHFYTSVWRVLDPSSRFGTSGLWDSNVIPISCYRDCSFGFPSSLSCRCCSNKLNHLATDYTPTYCTHTNVTASGSDQHWSFSQNPSIYSNQSSLPSSSRACYQATNATVLLFNVLAAPAMVPLNHHVQSTWSQRPKQLTNSLRHYSWPLAVPFRPSPDVRWSTGDAAVGCCRTNQER